MEKKRLYSAESKQLYAHRTDETVRVKQRIKFTKKINKLLRYAQTYTYASLSIKLTKIWHRRLRKNKLNVIITTSPPTHSVGARLVMLSGVCRRL